MSERLLRWRDIYSETELYKAAVALYTKPVFNWRKGLSHSSDGETFYDFARNGLAQIAELHNRLSRGKFVFKPAVKLDFNLNGKQRSFYIYPWQERLADLLLYRILSGRRIFGFLPSSYAYRLECGGINRCQHDIKRALSGGSGPLYVVKRDISNYFPSIDHGLLLEAVARHVDEKDYLFSLLASRVRFEYFSPDGVKTADRGVAFGTPTACFLSNLYLTPLDRELCAMPQIRYFRYADDFLIVSPVRAAAEAAARALEDGFTRLRLSSKSSHSLDLRLRVSDAADKAEKDGFSEAEKFRHLGLEYCADGNIRLSRDKFRKLCNIFNCAFRRAGGRLRKIKDTDKRIALAVRVAAQAAADTKRNVAIIDYYLTHVTDEAQLRLLDRWVAEETLAVALQRGHKKGNFKICSYARLRQLGLPSLAHRARLIRHGHIEAPFFVRRAPGIKDLGTTVRPSAVVPPSVFSPCPEAAACETPVGKGGRLSAGVIEEINALR